MRRLACPLAALALLAALLPGCGGGEEDSTGMSAVSTEQQAPAGAGAQAPAEGESPKREKIPTPPPARPAAPPRHVPVAEPTPGSKAIAPGVPTTKGGDNSIQGFGTEGKEDPREEAIANLLAFREARLSGEWERACAFTSEQFREQLELLIEKARAKGDTPKPRGCPETLALFTPEEARAALRQRFQVSEVLSFRVDGEYAYLIFKGAEGKTMFVAMADDGGEWKVNVLEPEAFRG